MKEKQRGSWGKEVWEYRNLKHHSNSPDTPLLYSSINPVLPNSKPLLETGFVFRYVSLVPKGFLRKELRTLGNDIA